MKMKLFIILATTLVSSALSFLPKLFSIEKFIQSPGCNLNRVCQKLPTTNNDVAALHGSWRLLKPTDPETTVYQTIDREHEYALTSKLFANGTRIHAVMPFVACRRNETIYFNHARIFTVFADDSGYTSNATCSSQSFELVYASTSIRVDKVVATGAFRVYVPCEEVFLEH
ncbi:unnamed protein product [Ectocarpus sp. 6 AP-2014]